MISLITSLLVTLVIENVVALGLFRQANKKKIIMVVTAANLLTNPLLNYTISYGLNPLESGLGFTLFYLLPLLVLEILVVVMEAYIYLKYFNFTFRHALFMSAILNVLSLVLGLMALYIGSTVLYILTPRVSPDLQINGIVDL